MLRLIGRRVLTIIPVLLIVSFGVFMLIALVPGNVAETLAGGSQATPAQIAQVREQLHLDEPLIVQYGHWLWNAIHLNFGRSLITGQSVMGQIGTRLPVTASV